MTDCGVDHDERRIMGMEFCYACAERLQSPEEASSVRAKHAQKPLRGVDYLALLAEHYRRVLIRIAVPDSDMDAEFLSKLAYEALEDAGWLPHGVVGPRDPRDQPS